MTLNFLLILASLGLLFLGAETLVRGSASLASRAGLNPLLIGLTIVAFGTSAPELLVSINAVLSGQGDLAIGNVVGSNSLNIGIILGLTALVCPIPIQAQVIRLDAPLALGAAVLLPLLLIDGGVARWEGGLLLATLVLYTYVTYTLARRQRHSFFATDLAEALPEPSRHASLDVAFVVAGLALLAFGARLLVTHAVIVAESFGVSQAVIGLTIVAAGTSMPELATSVLAALRRQPDIAVGNVVGSNIMNVLGIVGVSGVWAPFAADGVTGLDYGMMIAFSAILIPLIWTGRRLLRLEGALLLIVYGAYLWILWP